MELKINLILKSREEGFFISDNPDKRIIVCAYFTRLFGGVGTSITVEISDEPKKSSRPISFKQYADMVVASIEGSDYLLMEPAQEFIRRHDLLDKSLHICSYGLKSSILAPFEVIAATPGIPIDIVLPETAPIADDGLL